LRFEFSAYHAVMPRHWSDRADKDRIPDLELRGWMAGQAASAAASMKLLAKRATATSGDARVADSGTPWLDFADYDCFACHHNLLNDVAARFQRAGHAAAPRRVATSTALEANTWYTAVLDQALSAGRLDHSHSDSQRIRINDAISSAVAGRRDVASMARAVSSDLDRAVSALISSPPLCGADRNVLMDRLCANADSSWDGMAQRYLALAATYHAENDLRAAMPALHPLIMDLGRQVHFPRWDSVIYDSPATLQQTSRIAEFQKDIDMIRAELHREMR
jgi:hypothetical protein